MAKVAKEKKPVKPWVRVLAVGLWVLVGIMVIGIFLSDDEPTAEKMEYEVTQQRYDDAGILYITAKADVKDDEQTAELVKQIESEHKDKQDGSVESMFVHVFNAEDTNQGIYKIAYTNKGKAQTGLDQLNEWTKQ